MIEYSIYPGGRHRIVTFSYDDGPEQDARLIELFNRYGVKGTFHLNGKRLLRSTAKWETGRLILRFEAFLQNVQNNKEA